MNLMLPTVRNYYMTHIYDERDNPFTNKNQMYQGGETARILGDISIKDLYKICFELFKYFFNEEKYFLDKCPIKNNGQWLHLDKYTRLYTVTPIVMFTLIKNKSFFNRSILSPIDVVSILNQVNKNGRILDPYSQNEYKVNFSFNDFREFIFKLDLCGINHKRMFRGILSLIELREAREEKYRKEIDELFS